MIADLLNFSKSSASQMVDRLVEQGLLVRSEDTQDRRITWAALTTTGRDLTLACVAARSSWLADLSVLNESQRLAIVTALDELTAAFCASSIAECSPQKSTFTCNSLEKKPLMEIVIFGTTGQTGQQVLTQALQRGHQVTAAVRRPEAFTLRHECLAVVRADFVDQNSVETALSGQQVALSAVGAPMSRAHTSVHYDSARSILAAMQKTGVFRLICVTSGGTNPQHDPELPFFFEQIFKRMLY